MKKLLIIGVIISTMSFFACKKSGNVSAPKVSLIAYTQNSNNTLHYLSAGDTTIHINTSTIYFEVEGNFDYASIWTGDPAFLVALSPFNHKDTLSVDTLPGHSYNQKVIGVDTARSYISYNKRNFGVSIPNTNKVYSYTYYTPGTYTIVLVAVNTDKWSDNEKQTVYYLPYTITVNK